jgi:hypothetical protein
MKPFTFMTVVLGLILGFLFASSRQAAVVAPARRPSPPAVQYIADDSGAWRDREEAEGLPVPIVPGTRVTEARVQTPANVGPDGRPIGPRRLAPSVMPVASRLPSSTSRTVSSRLCATPERARADVRVQLEREVMDWLTPDVPAHWQPPSPLVDRMVRDGVVRYQEIKKDYGMLHEATLRADFSTARRDAFLAAYQREVVGDRLAVLAGILGFVLVCLAALAGYIRADEATKGYYTHWLRAVAAAGVGASGVLVYQWLA